MRPIDADYIMSAFGIFTDKEHGNEHFLYGIETAKEIVANAPTIGGWISVKDRLPESGKHVLVTCEIRSMYGYKKQYVCEAFHAEKHLLPEGKYPEDTDCYDYSEEDDEYYLKEGWYEVIHNWDDYGSVVICDFVTHWMPLPEPSIETLVQKA